MLCKESGVFTPVDRLLYSETGIQIITMLLFILGAVCFHTAKFLNGPKDALWFWMAKTCSPTAFNGTYVITHYTAWYSLVRWSVGSNCFLTTTEPLQSSFSIEPRPPRSGDLGPIVLARIRARLPCSHMPKRTELRGETRQVPKQRARCESTLLE